MCISELFTDKTIKPKEKTETICKWFFDKSLPIDELLAFAEKQKAPVKATCIEALEFATKQSPNIADETVLEFVTDTLLAKALKAVGFDTDKLVGNINALVADLVKLKPSTSKGVYLKKVAVSTTMGTGLPVDTASLSY